MEKEITKYIYFSFEKTPPELANTKPIKLSNHKIIKYLDHVFIQPLGHTPNHINPKNLEKIREKYKIKNLVLVDYLKSKKRIITIKDHVNKTGYNFLRAKTPFEKRETFPDMSKVYLSELGEVVFSVGSSFKYVSHLNRNYTTWVGAIAILWKYIGVNIYGFAYNKEFKFGSVLKHIKGELLWIGFL